ncbi:hypothetical protein HK405_005944 [Cladochytrium tenue]|nr:hypothetical protein HK405_005944 [Cladochytrium tenue]
MVRLRTSARGLPSGPLDAASVSLSGVPPVLLALSPLLLFVVARPSGGTGRPADAASAVTATIDATSNYGTWEGWGVSLAWWAAAFGSSREDLVDVLFTRNYTAVESQSLPGLGLNIVRYNAGASSWNSYNGSQMVVSPYMISGRQMNGLWVDGASSDPTSQSWNWTADANQVALLQAAVARGADTVELFSNSPMWWMCSNHNPSGANLGIDNLGSANYNQHAVYLATIASYAAQNWGVSFSSMDAFNEPLGFWSGLVGTQEGCHFEIATQAAMIKQLRSELDSRDLSGVIISAPDSNTYDQALQALNSLGSEAVSTIGRVNVHGYQYGGGNRDGLRAAAAANGLKVWSSEYSEGDTTGASLVRNLMLDLNALRPVAWVYWQAVDSVTGWGLLAGSIGTGGATIRSPAPQKFFALALFTRHIRPGMRMLAGGADNVVAAYDSAARRLVVVAVNWGDAQVLSFDISGFSTPGVDGALVRRWATLVGSDGGGDQYTPYNDTYISLTQFSTTFGANVSMAFEIENVSRGVYSARLRCTGCAWDGRGLEAAASSTEIVMHCSHNIDGCGRRLRALLLLDRRFG